MNNEEKFSEDPEEQMRIENELLKLKLQAELGAQFGGNMGDIPPEVEQQFLQQIMAFQQHQQEAPMVVFQEYIGSKDLPLAETFTEADLQLAWEKLEQLLEAKYIQLQFPEEGIETGKKYDFVVKDLFPLTIMQPQEGHGWIFDYEEFYPNHEKDMNRRTEEFMKDFFENDLTPDAWFLADNIVNSGAQQVITKEALIKKVNRFHDLFLGIKNYEYKVLETKVDAAQNPEDLTMGFVEGMLRYTIERDDREEQEIIGPFKLYFQKSGEWWEIFTFHVHGFSWD